MNIRYPIYEGVYRILTDVGLKIHSFRRMFGQQSGHQSNRLNTGVHIQPVFQAHVHTDG